MVSVRVPRFWVTVFLFAAAALVVVPRNVQAQMRVDLELLLAVDVSTSVDDAEYDLQTQGLARAFRDPEIQSAIRRAGPRGIAVAVVQWAGGEDQVVAIDWTHLRSPESLLRFGMQLAAMPRYIRGGDTWIGEAVRFAQAELVTNGYWATRQVIDLSGDGGVERLGFTEWARDDAVSAGVTVNGLAIENDVPDLGNFFRDKLIGGDGSFVMRARTYDDFLETMRTKLIREISHRPVARAFLR